MATIQVRDVPDDVHSVYQRRAAEAGLTLQEYLLAELVEGARTRTPADVVAGVERDLALAHGQGFSSRTAAEFVRADRDSR